MTTNDTFDLSSYYDGRLPGRQLRGLMLSDGGHGSRKEGVCATEAIAWLAGEAHSDHPACLCPSLGSFLRDWNDSLPDEDRTLLIRPLLVPAMLATVSPKASERRAWMALDWLVREHMVAWLRLAKLDDHADAFVAMPEIVSVSTLDVSKIDAAWDAAGDAAADAAGDAAGAVARAAAWSAEAAARAAAGDAAWAAARDAAGDAAGAAARDAARDAAGAVARAVARAAARAAAWDAARAAARDAARAVAGAAAWAAAGAAAGAAARAVARA
ncbi:hypothetical protein LCGC14_0798740, partial [marine sediment metagenome]